MIIISLEFLLSLLIVGSIVFYVACAFYTVRFFSRTDNLIEHWSGRINAGGINAGEMKFAEVTYRSGRSLAAPVSILVPVCGVDAGAWQNWSSLCTQDYPQYEVLFGVMDPIDPAVPVLEKLVAAFPDRTRLFTGLEPKGINHKDSNLSYLLDHAQYEVIILADSDIHVSADYIHTVTVPLADPDVGLVTCAFTGHNPQFLGAALASSGRCLDFIPSLLIAQALDNGLHYAVGATIAMRKSTLEDIGGLQFNRVGSDYDLGNRVAQAGYRVEMSRYVLESDTGRESVAQVFQRELRWARTIRFNHGSSYYGMVFCYGTVYCLPLLVLSGFANWAIALAATTLAVRLMQVLIAIFSMNCHGLLPWLWMMPLREVLSLLVWGRGAFGRSVYWRGRWLRVLDDAVVVS